MTYLQFTATLLAVVGAAVGLLSWQTNTLRRELTAQIVGVDEKQSARSDSLEQKMDTHIDSLEQKLDAKIDSLEQKMDTKFDAQNRILEVSLGAVDHRLTQLETDMQLVKQHLLGRPDAA